MPYIAPKPSKVIEEMTHIEILVSYCERICIDKMHNKSKSSDAIEIREYVENYHRDVPNQKKSVFLKEAVENFNFVTSCRLIMSIEDLSSKPAFYATVIAIAVSNSENLKQIRL